MGRTPLVFASENPTIKALPNCHVRSFDPDVTTTGIPNPKKEKTCVRYRGCGW